MNKLNQHLQQQLQECPAGQKDTGAGIVEASLSKLKVKAKAYGERIVMVCTETFASTIPALTDGDKEDKRSNGFIKKYIGMDVVILPNGQTKMLYLQMILAISLLQGYSR